MHDLKNLMIVLIKIQRSLHIYLFRKVLRDTCKTVFGRQECVVGKNYTTILFYLFIFNSRRDQVKDLTGSGCEDDVRRKSRSR